MSEVARPVVAVDLDEVLGRFVKALCTFHNEEYGTELTPDDFSSYRFSEVWGGSDEDATAKVKAFFKTTHFQEGVRARVGRVRRRRGRAHAARRAGRGD